MINARRCFILLLGERGAFLLPPAHLKSACAVFAKAGDKKETQAILDELAAAPRVPALLLYDGDDQHYQIETLPPLAPWDRGKVIARRLGAAFGNSFLRGVVSNPDKTVSLMAIKDGKAPALWLESLAKRAAFSQGVSLLAIESASMLARLTPSAAQGWVCLISAQQVSGLRAIVTHGGRLVFTRLLPSIPKGVSPQQISNAIAREVNALRSYLARMGLMPEMPLTLIALLAPTLHEALTNAPMDNVQRVILSPHEAAKRLGLSFAPNETDGYADAMHALWTLSRPRLRCVLMTGPAKERYWADITRRAGIIVAAVLLSIALIQTFIDSAFLIRKVTELPELRAEIAALQADYKAEQVALGGDAPQAAEMRKALERRRLFQSETPALIGLSRELAQALQNKAQLIDFIWQDKQLRFTARLMDEPAQGEATALAEGQVKESFLALHKYLQEKLPSYRIQLETRDNAARTATFVLKEGGDE